MTARFTSDAKATVAHEVVNAIGGWLYDQPATGLQQLDLVRMQIEHYHQELTKWSRDRG
ncbi:MAG: hypothetical protein ACRDUX_28985 [Mycobacterium sp.]